jgi:hypothetical protein
MLNVDFKKNYGLSEEEQQFNLILISGIYDLRPLVETDINGALKLDMNSATLYSPMLFNSPLISREKMKVLIAYGEHESSAFKEQSNLFASVSSLV